MRSGMGRAALLAAGLVVGWTSGPARLRAQTVGGGATAVEVSLSKPLMGENYDPLTGFLGVEGRIARSNTSGYIVSGGLVRSTQGRATSATLANPTLGIWMKAGLPLELEVSVPLMREFGDDDFATDVARLSDQQHRERYLPGRWAVSLATTPRLVFRDGSSGGVYLGGVAVLPHAGHDLDFRARYEGWFNLRFTPQVQGGARLAGTMRLNGSGGFDQRSQQDLALFLNLPGLPGFPELSFRLPVDIDLQDFVTGVVGVRLRF